MIDIILNGIFIGLCISVPLGPIGMLCVQRTFNRGRRHGVVTGLGATTSDFVYVIISLFFFSFVTPIINSHLFAFQITGSLIVCVFGYFIFKNNPSMQPKPNETVSHSLLGDYVSAFGLTFSNPLILFVLIALFARFDFIGETTTSFQKTCGITAILCGATLWWTALTFFVNKFRIKVNMRGLRIINQITGCIIFIIGCIGAVMSILEKSS